MRTCLSLNKMSLVIWKAEGKCPMIYAFLSDTQRKN